MTFYYKEIIKSSSYLSQETETKPASMFSKEEIEDLAFPSGCFHMAKMDLKQKEKSSHFSSSVLSKSIVG